MADVPNFSPALAPLWRAVHERLSSGRPVTRIRLGPLTVEQREALADLLGSARLPGENLSVSLAELDDALGTSVRDVVIGLVGPLADRAADRSRAAAERIWGRPYVVTFRDRNQASQQAGQILDLRFGIRHSAWKRTDTPRARSW